MNDADPIAPPVNAPILAARLADAELQIVRGSEPLLLTERPAARRPTAPVQPDGAP